MFRDGMVSNCGGLKIKPWSLVQELNWVGEEEEDEGGEGGVEM